MKPVSILLSRTDQLTAATHKHGIEKVESYGVISSDMGEARKMGVTEFVVAGYESSDAERMRKTEGRKSVGLGW